jgi:hypothetical protein
VSEFQALSADASALNEVDEVFALLDGVSISTGRGEWSSRIQGIYSDGPYLWVQLSLDGHGTRSITLRLPRPTTLDDIIRALEAVEADSSTVGGISRM